MWAPGNTVDCRAPRQPSRTCDSPSGCKPHTGAPLHHPVKTKQTSVCVCACKLRRCQCVCMCVSSWEKPSSSTHTCPSLCIDRRKLSNHHGLRSAPSSPLNLDTNHSLVHTAVHQNKRSKLEVQAKASLTLNL